MKTAIIIVDHGSSNVQSNRLLDEIVAAFARKFARFEIVEAAHMTLAEPSIGTAYARCIQRGAKHVLVLPFFLGPGKHYSEDIPKLTAQAWQLHPGTTWHVAQPLGPDDLIVDLLGKRVDEALAGPTREKGGAEPQWYSDWVRTTPPRPGNSQAPVNCSLTNPPPEIRAYG